MSLYQINPDSYHKTFLLNPQSANLPIRECAAYSILLIMQAITEFDSSEQIVCFDGTAGQLNYILNNFNHKNCTAIHRLVGALYRVFNFEIVTREE